ncbi:MAG: GNAT family N-acetyltransferase [Stagnimonas sp.]|nr:GNAT family N-acetyltransferase [Stagnimonas sp.]
MSDIRYQALNGAAIREHLQVLAALRLTVFREWPYLYDGTLDYERQYLETYARCNESIAVLAWEGSHCVGATTALPMPSAEAAMRKPFEQAALDVSGTLYFGESVVLGKHRGRGIGVTFFEQREAHARALGLKRCAFCAVDRPANHPLMPAAYMPNDTFWTRRGYARQPALQCTFEWQDRGEPAPTPHKLTYWSRDL